MGLGMGGSFPPYRFWGGEWDRSPRPRGAPFPAYFTYTPLVFNFYVIKRIGFFGIFTFQPNCFFSNFSPAFTIKKKVCNCLILKQILTFWLFLFYFLDWIIWLLMIIFKYYASFENTIKQS